MHPIFIDDLTLLLLGIGTIDQQFTLALILLVVCRSFGVYDMAVSGSINQPYFFPYIGFFQMLEKSEIFVSLDDVSMIKRGFVHRNYIMCAGSLHRFTLPLKSVSQNKSIRHTYTSDWPAYSQQFWRKLEHSYSREIYFNQLEQIWGLIDKSNNLSIAELALQSLQATASFLGLKTKFLRHNQNSASGSSGSARIVEICEENGITDYWNLPGGRSLYSNRVFERKKISLSFVEVNDCWKRQSKIGELSHVSMLDIVTRFSREEILSYLHDNKDYVL